MVTRHRTGAVVSVAVDLALGILSDWGRLAHRVIRRSVCHAFALAAMGGILGGDGAEVVLGWRGVLVLAGVVFGRCLSADEGEETEQQSRLH